jgi:dimethylaniline monooxygenase (N-oxide forming)
VKAGKINIIAPARATHFGVDGTSIVLHDGQEIKTDAVIFATGYSSSWKDILDGQLFFSCEYIEVN